MNNKPKKLSFEAESCFSKSNNNNNIYNTTTQISPIMLLKKAEINLLNSPSRFSNFNENYVRNKKHLFFYLKKLIILLKKAKFKKISFKINFFLINF